MASRRRKYSWSSPSITTRHPPSACMIQVKGLTRHVVLTARDALNMIAQGNGRQHVGPTMMNHHSSRSHRILQLTVAQDCTQHATESVATITDLAGSDRCSKTEATGDTFRESKSINHSLLMLGRALNSMSKVLSFLQFCP